MEASVLPAYEMSCKTMFDQIDSTFQKGMVEFIHSPLAFALRVRILESTIPSFFLLL